MTNQTKFFSIAYVLFGFFIPLILLQDVHLTIFMSFMFLSVIIYYVVRILFFKIRKRFKLKHPDIVLPSVIGSIFLVAFSLMFVQYLRYDNYLYIEFLYMYASFCFAVFYLLLISTFAKAKQRLYQDEINQKSELNNLQAKYVGILNIPQHIKTETDKKREELHAVEVRFREIVYSDPTFTQLKAEYCSSKVCDLLEYYINTDQANDIESCISVFSKESVDIKMQYSTNI